MKEWMKVWIYDSQYRSGIRRAWPTTVEQFKALKLPEFARHVRGPLSAVVASLLRVGWDPVAPDLWHVPEANDRINFDWQFNESLESIDQAQD
eukprot:9491041-Pyramimonas_sp.AAC.1